MFIFEFVLVLFIFYVVLVLIRFYLQIALPLALLIHPLITLVREFVRLKLSFRRNEITAVEYKLKTKPLADGRVHIFCPHWLLVNRPEPTFPWHRFIGRAMQMLGLMHTPLSSISISAFHCSQYPDGRFYVASAPSQEW